MFKNEFQGGPYVEVFSAQGRDPVAKWRLSGNASTAKKIFVRDVKSYVFILEGESTTTKMSIPKDEKQSLSLVQKYLILQVFVPLGHSFSFELGITDMGNNKRRIFMSSSHREVTVTPLHARFPLSILRLGVWLNLCLDLNSLMEESFKGQAFKAMESLTISANCHLRKIFTMKTQPPDTTDDDDIYGCVMNSGEVEAIPKAMQFTTTPDVQHYTQVINITKLRQAELRAREAAGLPPPSTPTISDSDTSKQEDKPTHIAFGSRVIVPKHARKISRDGPSSAGGRSSSDALSRSSSASVLRAISPENDSARDKDAGRERAKTISVDHRSMSDLDSDSTKTPLGVEATQTTMQPRPPRTGSGNKSGRRPVRVRGSSGGKGRSSRSESMSERKKLDDSTSGYHKPEQKYSTDKYEKDSESSCSESRSRSQSESSLKASGNDSSLGESFSKLNINGNKKQSTTDKTNSSKSTKESLFTFSSKPRARPRSPRTPQRKKEDSVTSSVDTKPDILITPGPDIKVTESVPMPRARRESERSENDEDFYRASGESSEEDDLQKLLKSSSSTSRASSRAGRPSPRSSPQPPQTPHVLRASIRSSLLKEIPFQSVAAKSYEAKTYQSNASSWRFDTSDSSSSLLDQSFGSSFGGDGGFTTQRGTSNGTGNTDRVIHDDGEESHSDDSDESCSTWKVPPPPSKRLHCYQDEMMHPGSEPDLSATLPMDPRAYTDVFSPPIIMPSEKRQSAQGSQASISAALSPSNSMNQGYPSQIKPRSHNHSISSDHDDHERNELELDLLYDPCLNCYFDPKTHKYYELA